MQLPPTLLSGQTQFPQQANPFDRVKAIYDRKKDFDHAYGDDTFSALAGLAEEVLELEKTITGNEPPSRQLDELGDVLYDASRLGLYLGLEPEKALHSSCDKVSRRFDVIEEIARGPETHSSDTNPFKNLTKDECQTLWKQAKELLRQQKIEN